MWRKLLPAVRFIVWTLFAVYALYSFRYITCIAFPHNPVFVCKKEHTS